MARNVLRGVLIGMVLGLVAFAGADEADAFCHWLQNRYNTAAAMYGGGVCNPCGQQVTANYVPQTCYRVQYVNVPVTTYRPVVSCDPCSGCQQVCMKPTTCYRQQAQYVPYTTYRIVYSQTQPACATTAYYAPTAVAAPAAVGVPTSVAAPVLPSSGCSSCGTGAATTSYYGSTTNYAPATGYGVVPSGATVTQYGAATTVAPMLTTTSGTGYTYNYPSGGGFNRSYSYAPSYGAPGIVTTPSPSRPAYSGQTYVGPSQAVPTYTPPTNPTPVYSSPPFSGAVPSGTPGLTYAAPPSGGVITQTTPVQTNYPPVQTYQSGTPVINGTPTPAPNEVRTETRVETKTETKVEVQKPSDELTPIPDSISEPKFDGPNLPLNKTSSPRLFDPQDKTAAAWPTQRAWGYAPIGVRTASRTELTPAATLSTITPTAAEVDVERNPITLGAIAPSPAPIAPQPTVDANGWQSSGR